MKRFLLLGLAHGFGTGTIPWAPGTFGSIVGMAWFALLLSFSNLPVFCLGTLAGLALSVWIGGQAESLLGQKDPGSVVLDEIAAIPLCFAGWIALHCREFGAMPGLGDFFNGHRLWAVVGVFVAFRVFDITKPWPIRQSQAWPGGWGLTVDDVLAAAYVNAGFVLFYFLWSGDRSSPNLPGPE